MSVTVTCSRKCGGFSGDGIHTVVIPLWSNTDK